MQYKLLIVQSLPLLTSAVAIASVGALKAPTMVDLAQVEIAQEPFSALSSDTGAILRTIQRNSTSANETTGAVSERTADLTTELNKRTISGPICSGGHTPPSRDDCARVISSWAALMQTRGLSVNSCDEITYGSCLGYICATQCNAIQYDTNYVRDRLQDINGACVVNNGEAGFIHSTGGTNSDGSAYGKFEIGLERYSGELPAYEPCA